MTKQILVLDVAQISQQPANETIVLMGPLDTSTFYITATGQLTLMPGGTSGVQFSTGGNARGEYSSDFQLSRSADTQVASGSSSVILGGARNTASNKRSAVISGADNSVASWAACIVSGDQGSIDATSSYSVIVGGQYNQINASNWSGVVVGNTCTVNTADNAIISGGVSNHITSSTGSVVAGGSNNNINNSVVGIISGGLGNTVNASYSSVCGGKTNVIGSTYSVIGGGLLNTLGASATYGGILSGYYSSVTASYSGVCTGRLNSVAGSNSVVCGGQSNSVSGNYSSAMGGYSNIVNNSFSTSLGGRECSASADYSIVMGYNSKTTHYGSFAYSGSPGFLSQGDSQRILLTLKRATSNTTPRYMYVDGVSATMDIPANTSWTFSALVNAFKTDGSQTGGYLLQGVIYRDGSLAPVFVGSPVITVLGETDATWDCIVEAAANRLDIKVTGAAASAINWTARVEIIQNTVTL